MKTVLCVLVNFGDEQLGYLDKVVSNFNNFKNYNVTVIVNSNIAIDIKGVNKVNIIELENYQLLPLTCRKVIWDNRDNYDLFIYGENDHLFKEVHLNKHLEYTKILPPNRIPGLIQYEENETGRYYPGYHLNFDWDYDSVEVYQDKVFAHFSNLHQATFILTKKQLFTVGKSIDFLKLSDNPNNKIEVKLKNKLRRLFRMSPIKHYNYSLKCKVNTDVYEYGKMKKLICISEFESNLIKHLPNVYIDGTKGRNKLRSDDGKMKKALQKLLTKAENKREVAGI